MYTKEEAREITTLFWTSFGKYMQKHTSQFQFHNKWVNYKTGVKDVYFRLKIDKSSASVSIELQQKDDGIRELYFQQFEELKRVFTDIVGEWNWEPNVIYQTTLGNYLELSSISISIPEVNLYNKDTWQKAFYFFEEHIVKLDEFWADFNEIFKQLE